MLRRQRDVRSGLEEPDDADRPTVIVPRVAPGRADRLRPLLPWAGFAVAAVVVLIATSAWAATLRGPRYRALADVAPPLVAAPVTTAPTAADPPAMLPAPVPGRVVAATTAVRPERVRSERSVTRAGHRVSTFAGSGPTGTTSTRAPAARPRAGSGSG